MSKVSQKQSAKPFTMNILNGLALGTVVVLIPGAILGELMKALLPLWSGFGPLISATAVATSMMGLVIGMLIGGNFKFNPIQSASLGLAVVFAGGAANIANGVITMKGTGDIINMGITAALGVLLIQFLSDKTKSFTLIIIPTLTLLLVGGIGHFMLPYVKMITTIIGQGIASLLGLQPILMSILIAMIFCFLIVSPITTVGIALAISLSGIGSGAANLGICAASFGLCIAGWSVNSKGTALAHVLGSPKISMANVLSKPKIILPMLSSSVVLGILAALFNIQGTPASAGFGISGLIGPINALNLAAGGWSLTNVLMVLVIFIGAPIILSLFFNYVFIKMLKVIDPEDYKLDL
ncbi:PTS sugar transporter subunit IIC [Streptococcus didelphis]|uniref:PTS sugar transporter subunit IIC n=1 Tax=Streptococcus didelphis TaxID=102886 RepID=A0ABY9LHD7_9STRE|nr:PTS sugar transporter subunit IIC [Streptococcus didelphis]WMB28277.1 PTS sugar transporter subunit IIC [Streptococcus didelphis]